MDIGYCDKNGDLLTLHCALCDWTRTTTTTEEAEFRFCEHARQAHNQNSVLRRDPDTGVATELTDSDGN